MTLEGRVLNGTIVLHPPATLPEGSRVRVEVLTAETPAPSLFDRLGDLAGKAANLPPDASEQHDHYLYGAPKSS
jgi:hypothetical protein